jgi:hypothetical protein
VAYLVPILQIVPKHEKRTEQLEVIDLSFRNAIEGLEVNSLFRICDLSRYRRLRSSAAAVGREALRVYTPQDILNIANPSDISVIFGSDITPEDAQGLCQATRVNYFQLNRDSDGNPIEQDYFIVNALKFQG